MSFVANQVEPMLDESQLMAEANKSFVEEFGQKPKVSARDDAQKVDLAQIFWFKLEELARLMTAGRKKYPDEPGGKPNWLLGGKPDAEYIKAALRHLMKMQRGVVVDHETMSYHAMSVAWNMFALITTNYPSLEEYMDSLDEVQRNAIECSHEIYIKELKKKRGES